MKIHRTFSRRPATKLSESHNSATVSDFDHVVHENRQRIYRAACFLLEDAAEAEDLTQTVFVQAWRGWPAFRGQSATYTWLYRILLRAARRHRRRQWWRLRLARITGAELDRSIESVPDSNPPPDAAARSADDCMEVRAVMRTMSPKLREVLVLRYSEQLSLAEIAAALGVPEGTVKSRLNLAQAAVAQRLRQRGWK